MTSEEKAKDKIYINQLKIDSKIESKIIKDYYKEKLGINIFDPY